MYHFASKQDSFRPMSSIRGAGYTAKSKKVHDVLYVELRLSTFSDEKRPPGGRSSVSSGRGSPGARLLSGTPVMVPNLRPSSDDQSVHRYSFFKLRYWNFNYRGIFFSSASSVKTSERKLRTLLDEAVILASKNRITEVILEWTEFWDIIII